jgi:hypothetical protein
MSGRDKIFVVTATLIAFVAGLIIAPELHEWFASLWR